MHSSFSKIDRSMQYLKADLVYKTKERKNHLCIIEKLFKKLEGWCWLEIITCSLVMMYWSQSHNYTIGDDPHCTALDVIIGKDREHMLHQVHIADMVLSNTVEIMHACDKHDKWHISLEYVKWCN